MYEADWKQNTDYAVREHTKMSSLFYIDNLFNESDAPATEC